MKDEIKAILDRHIDFGAWQGKYHIEGKVTGVDAAAEAIAALPVDRVQAMATLVSPHSLGVYNVPSGKGRMPHCVASYTSGLECDCGKGRCKHIQAVELYLARQ